MHEITFTTGAQDGAPDLNVLHSKMLEILTSIPTHFFNQNVLTARNLGAKKLASSFPLGIMLTKYDANDKNHIMNENHDMREGATVLMDRQHVAVVMGQPIDPLRDARSAAQRAFIAANVAYYGKIFLILGASAAATYGTVYAGSRAAAGNNAIPDKIGIPSQDQYGNPVYGAVAHCTSILLGYVNSGFASASTLPANHSDPVYTMMMNAFKFACGGISNVTLGGSTFVAPNGNICNDVSHSMNGPDDNAGTLHAMFGMLTQLAGNPMLNLDCQNASNFAGYVTLALFAAIVAAALLLGGYLYLRSPFVDRPKSSDFFSDAALRERTQSITVQEEPYGSLTV